MYIVLPDPVQPDPTKLGPHGMFVRFNLFYFIFLFLETANFSTVETHDGKYCTPGCPTLSTLVRIQKVTLMFFSRFSQFSLPKSSYIVGT